MKFSRMIDRAGVRIMPTMPRLGIGLRAWASKSVGERELALLPSLVSKDKLAIDVGANWGVYSYRLARLAAGVVAFEPNPLIASMLARAVPGIQVQACALGSKAGTATLHIPAMANGELAWGHASLNAPEGSSKPVTVAVKRLDDFGLRNVGFIKIDVEGFECEVLAGAMGTLERDHPVLLIEAADEAALTGIAEMLAPLGYAGSFYANCELRPLRAWPPVRPPGEKPYVNFVFRCG